MKSQTVAAVIAANAAAIAALRDEQRKLQAAYGLPSTEPKK